MKHRKVNLQEYILPCRDHPNGSCWYGAEMCWFSHGEVNIENQSVQNQESEPSMMNRLFSMMEQFAERTNNLENQL